MVPADVSTAVYRPRAWSCGFAQTFSMSLTRAVPMPARSSWPSPGRRDQGARVANARVSALTLPFHLIWATVSE
jgi:hypothetical protein